jgi:hypothetical protein
MQEAILKTWVSIVLNPPDDFVKLLTTETKKQTNILPSKKDIIFFLRNIARQSTVNRIQQKTKNERKIFNEVITVSASHCDSYKDESPKCFCFGGKNILLMNGRVFYCPYVALSQKKIWPILIKSQKGLWAQNGNTFPKRDFSLILHIRLRAPMCMWKQISLQTT